MNVAQVLAFPWEQVGVDHLSAAQGVVLITVEFTMQG